MGIEYSLFSMGENEKPIEAFDLDKGCWISVFHFGDNIFDLQDIKKQYPTPSDMAKVIHEEVYPHLDESYALIVAERIFEWCKNKPTLRFVNDCSWDFYHSVPTTADRFVK